MTASLVIAIDGPAAAGKGTLARRLAAVMNLPYLDTGLLYRAVGRRVLETGQRPDDADAAADAVAVLSPADLLRGDLRGPDADSAASQVAAHPAVRAALVQFQRDFAQDRGAVLDGRDIGTAIFPDADAKLFVTASDAARARRRWLELQGRGENIALDSVAADMAARDARDAARAVAPLRPADDALILDTTALDADGAMEAALNLLCDKLGSRLILHPDAS